MPRTTNQYLSNRYHLKSWGTSCQARSINIWRSLTSSPIANKSSGSAGHARHGSSRLLATPFSSLGMVLLGFSKHFDRVSHKLKHLGVKRRVHKWIDSFLLNKSQEVVFEGVFSERNAVTSRLLQGPLFLLFINDWFSYAKHSNMHLLVDDCILYKKVSSTTDGDLLQQDLDSLYRRETDAVRPTEMCYVNKNSED